MTIYEDFDPPIVLVYGVCEVKQVEENLHTLHRQISPPTALSPNISTP